MYGSISETQAQSQLYNVPVIFRTEKISQDFTEEPDFTDEQWDTIEGKINLYKQTMAVLPESHHHNTQ